MSNSHWNQQQHFFWVQQRKDSSHQVKQRGTVIPSKLIRKKFFKRQLVFCLNGPLKLCQWQLKVYRAAWTKMKWSLILNEVTVFSLNYSFSGKDELLFVLFCFVCQWVYMCLSWSWALPGLESVGKKSCCSISQSGNKYPKSLAGAFLLRFPHKRVLDKCR